MKNEKRGGVVKAQTELYNSGSIQGEGCYHYKPAFDTPPEKFGFVFQEKIRTIDVYVRK